MNKPSLKRMGLLVLFGLLGAMPLAASVSRPIQDRYRKDYENKALFLRIPVFGERATVYISGRNVRPEAATGIARFKVGDQLRVLGLEFGGDEIRFRLGQIAGPGVAEVVFKFDSPLAENFPNSDVFEKAVQAAFTEGLKYTDLEEAKRGYVEDQFDRNVRELAETAGTNRDLVLKTIAPKLPAYQDAMRDIDNLKSRNQELGTQLTQTQSDSRKLEAELKSQQSEILRLRSANSALQEKIDSSTTELSRLGDEVRNVRGLTQGYQKELATIQRSLNIRVDSGRDLAAQISDLGQVLQKLQKENSTLDTQSTSLRQSLENQRAANTKLLGENDDLKNANRQMHDTISALTSKEDSLARQFLQVKQNRDNLQDLVSAAQNINSKLVEESTTGGVYSARFNIYLREVLLGALTVRLPDGLSHQQEKAGEAVFASESIDYVKLSPDERLILRSLGDRLKLQLKLASVSEGMAITPQKGDAVQEIGERDSATWRWNVTNRGTQDAHVLITARLINRNSDEIPLMQGEHLVKSSTLVRQVRSYLQPIPMTVGGVIGFLLFGLIGIFRRKTPEHPHREEPSPSTYVGHKKQL
jgi:predicted nuclease with TOPRIM domain